MRLLFLLFGVASASCGDLRIDYVQQGCCHGSDCEISVRACSEVTNGKICFDGTDLVVKGMAEAFGFEDDRIVLKKSIIPDTHNAYDFGSAEYKIRDIYEHDA